MTTTEWHAIVLAGGRAIRLGGIDKTALRFEGMSLLEHALAAVAGAQRTVVVGPERLRPELPGHVTLVTEHPAFGGPAAATAAGLRALGAEPGSRVALVAADLPHSTAAVHELLGVRSLVERVDGIVATDDAGRAQPLLAIYDASALTAAVDLAEASGPLAGSSMRNLLAPLTLCHVQLPDALCADVDTPAAAARHGILLDLVPSHA
jgi:molybdopterin-guanine dinucleotide biosynthesis protein A